VPLNLTDISGVKRIDQVMADHYQTNSPFKGFLKQRSKKEYDLRGSMAWPGSVLHGTFENKVRGAEQVKHKSKQFVNKTKTGNGPKFIKAFNPITVFRNQISKSVVHASVSTSVFVFLEARRARSPSCTGGIESI
jgi:hypothetical protein